MDAYGKGRASVLPCKASRESKGSIKRLHLDMRGRTPFPSTIKQTSPAPHLCILAHSTALNISKHPWNNQSQLHHSSLSAPPEYKCSLNGTSWPRMRGTVPRLHKMSRLTRSCRKSCCVYQGRQDLHCLCEQEWGLSLRWHPKDTTALGTGSDEKHTQRKVSTRNSWGDGTPTYMYTLCPLYPGQRQDNR